MESAMTSRDGSEDFMPSWPMAMPSVTVMVQNSRGVAPTDGDALLHRLGLPHQRDVAGRGLVPAGGDADERLMDLLPRSAPSRSRTRGAAPAPALRWRGGLAASISDWSLRPSYSYGLKQAPSPHSSDPAPQAIGAGRQPTIDRPPTAAYRSRKILWPKSGAWRRCSARTTNVPALLPDESQI